MNEWMNEWIILISVLESCQIIPKQFYIFKFYQSTDILCYYTYSNIWIQMFTLLS